MSGEGGGRSASSWVLILVAIIGLVASPAWGPAICRAVGVCQSDTQDTGGGAPTIPPHAGPAEIFLSRTGGPAGSKVSVSGDGFSAGETVVIRFHTDEVAKTKAGANGSFSGVEITVPESYAVFATQQFMVFATGESSIMTATAPFTVSG
jgi:hypothetical protein